MQRVNILQDLLQVVRVDFGCHAKQMIIEWEHHPEWTKDNNWVNPEVEWKQIDKEANNKPCKIGDHVIVGGNAVDQNKTKY